LHRISWPSCTFNFTSHYDSCTLSSNSFAIDFSLVITTNDFRCTCLCDKSLHVGVDDRQSTAGCRLCPCRYCRNSNYRAELSPATLAAAAAARCRCTPTTVRYDTDAGPTRTELSWPVFPRNSH